MITAAANEACTRLGMENALVGTQEKIRARGKHEKSD